MKLFDRFVQHQRSTLRHHPCNAIVRPLFVLFCVVLCLNEIIKFWIVVQQTGVRHWVPVQLRYPLFLCAVSLFVSEVLHVTLHKTRLDFKQGIARGGNVIQIFKLKFAFKFEIQNLDLKFQFLVQSQRLVHNFKTSNHCVLWQSENCTQYNLNLNCRLANLYHTDSRTLYFYKLLKQVSIFRRFCFHQFKFVEESQHSCTCINISNLLLYMCISPFM